MTLLGSGQAPSKGDGAERMDYLSESQALDREILGVINAWHQHGAELKQGEFDDLALRLFDYQLRYDPRYARYCERLGVTRDAFPGSWEAIPAVPAPAFKEATLATFDVCNAALTFETSGTTDGRPGRHYLETPALYDAALLAGFRSLDARRRSCAALLQLRAESARGAALIVGIHDEASGRRARRWKDRLVPARRRAAF